MSESRTELCTQLRQPTEPAATHAAAAAPAATVVEHTPLAAIPSFLCDRQPTSGSPRGLSSTSLASAMAGLLELQFGENKTPHMLYDVHDEYAGAGATRSPACKESMSERTSPLCAFCG